MQYAPKKEETPSVIKTYALRISLYLAVLLLVLIPTYIAITAYSVQKNAPTGNVQTAYSELQMTGPGNKSLHASASENTALFSIFTALCQSGNEVVSLPDTHVSGHYTVTMKTAELADSYDFYFLSESDTCYYTAPSGKIFRCRDEQVSDFLNGPYSFELYEAASIPLLTTAATDEVLPVSVTWHYRTANGQFTQHTQSDTAWQTQTYPIANDISFYFSIQPSSHEIVIRRAGTELYRGTSDGISLPLADNEVLDFEIRATFDADSRVNYYGELRYRFRMQVVEAAHFSLNADVLQVGDILLLTCENIKNAEKLQITAQPALAAEPILFRRGDHVYAAIPATNVGEYTLHVTYGTVSAVFTPSISPVTGTAISDTSDLNGDWVTLLYTKLPDLIRAHGATSDSGLTPSVLLNRPQGDKLFSFGDQLAVPNADNALALPFDLYRVSGTVNALAAGRVLLAGNDLHLGRYVIVDHGCGLYTWYAGLSELRVSAGDVLAVGDVVGLPSTMLHREQSALFMVTMGKAAVSSDLLFD